MKYKYEEYHISITYILFINQNRIGIIIITILIAITNNSNG